VTSEHDALRRALGRAGAWTFAFDGLPAREIRSSARAIESLGYGALWVPEGGGSREVFAHLSLLLSATERITVCSGVANITARHAEAMAAGAATLADAFEGRAVLGMGVGHQVTTARRGLPWDRPVERMRDYVDAMGATAWGRRMPILLAALGDAMLRLSAERALGAHTYFVPVEHTERARGVLGGEPVLAVEQTVVLESDPAEARRIARGFAVHYLELPNYAGNWRRLGFGEDDVAGGGSDRLIDAAFAWGDVAAVADRVRAHLDAGADHVCVQVISDDEADVCLEALEALAPALLAL
jgi:probable F420-dependent oxidoreductase